VRVIAAKANSVAVRIKGQPSQTAHPLEQTDTGNNPVAWWEPDGRWRAPNLGHTLTFTVAGTLTVATGKFRIYNDTGVTLTIRAVRASVNTAPTGAAIRVDVNKNGTTIFTTQGNRPNIAVSTNTSKVTNMDAVVDRFIVNRKHEKAIRAGIASALLAWARRAELSCDRAAMLVMQDPHVIGRTMMKLSGGTFASRISATSTMPP